MDNEEEPTYQIKIGYLEDEEGNGKGDHTIGELTETEAKEVIGKIYSGLKDKANYLKLDFPKTEDRELICTIIDLREVSYSDCNTE